MVNGDGCCCVVRARLKHYVQDSSAACSRLSVCAASPSCASLSLSLLPLPRTYLYTTQTHRAGTATALYFRSLGLHSPFLLPAVLLFASLSLLSNSPMAARRLKNFSPSSRDYNCVTSSQFGPSYSSSGPSAGSIFIFLKGASALLALLRYFLTRAFIRVYFEAALRSPRKKLGLRMLQNK